MAERKIDKETQAEEKEGTKSSRDEAEQLGAGAKVKSSTDGEAKGPGKKPRRKINS